MYHTVATGVPLYSHHVQKVEYANHAIKYYKNHLEELFYPEYRGWYGLSAVRMKRITHGACFAIKMHNNTGDVAALRHNLRNAIQHYFSDHQQCRSSFCKYTTTDTSNVLKINM